MTTMARITPDRSRPSPRVPARRLAWACPCRRFHFVMRHSTQTAPAATTMNQATASCPCGMTMAAVSKGPMAEPVLPPTWKVDCAVPKRPPDARRATRDASG